jgi:hypothetical protein
MRRSVILCTMVAVALVLGASTVALAATVNCTAATECPGTRHGDIINGSSGADEMSGRAGDYLMKGNGGSDEM